MKSKKKIVKRTTAIFGLAAVPTAAALGLSYGIRDSKINLSLAPANSYGEEYFDNQIVKVKDDDFAAGILYDPIKRSVDGNPTDAQTKVTIAKQKAADIAGLVRLDRKLDAKYARSVINIDDSKTDQGKVSVDGGLVYDFHGIKKIVTTKSGKTIFGKDIIKGMEQDAKSAITQAIYDFKLEHNFENNKIKKDSALRLGIYFDKNVIDRTVSIYLYELKDFNPDQNAVIQKFISNVENHPAPAKWIENFKYNLWDYNGLPKTAAQSSGSFDRIDGKSEMVDLPSPTEAKEGRFKGMDKYPSGFPEIFAGNNLMNAGVADNWYTLGGLSGADAIDLFTTKDGRLAVCDQFGHVFANLDDFAKEYPTGYGRGKITAQQIKDRVNKSKYISFEESNQKTPVVNLNTESSNGHRLGPINFVSNGIIPFIEPIVDFKNKVLKVKFTFKSFRKLDSQTTRSVANFNMGDDLEDPYQIATYIKEIPLDNMGNEGKDGDGKHLKIGDPTTKVYESFYEDETTNIDPRGAEYDSLKASVVAATKNTESHKLIGVGITKDNAKTVLRDFLANKTPAFSNIPIVGPGMGILGQMIPAIAASVQSWMDIGTMTAADPTITDIYDMPGFLDSLIDKINDDPLINPTGFINAINSFSKEAWSDLNSLINLSGKVLNGEKTARTYQLFQLLAAFNDISEPIFDAIKTNHPDAYMGNTTSVIDQLMAWLKKNGIIASGDSLMDIIDNYKERLGTIVESIGINRPMMKSELISSLVDLIPLPLFSQKGSEFNRDAAAVLDALLNGQYIKPVATDEKDDKHHSDTYDRNLPAIIELLNGNARTSVQTFFKHILNDNSKDLMKFILGVIGADYSKTDTFADAITALYTVFQAKVPKYVMIQDPSSSDPKDQIVKMQDVLDENGDPIINIDKSHKQEPAIEKDADGKDVMIVNPTFGGIGIALQNMYVNGIHSIPKDSYESVFKFIFGTIGSLVDMGTLSEQEIAEASEGLYHFVSQGAGHIVNGVSTSDLTDTDISGIIRAVNAIANKEVISPGLGTFIFDIMEKGVGSLTVDNIKPLITLLRPTLDGAGIGKGLTDEQIATTFNHLFTGFKGTGKETSDELSALIPGLDVSVAGTKLSDSIGQLVEGKGYTGIFKFFIKATTRDNLHKLLVGGIANMGDQDWVNFISNIKELLPAIKGEVPDKILGTLNILFNGDNTVKAFQGIGHLLHDGLVGIDYSDISTIINVINSLKLSFSIPDEQVLPISLLAQNILRNGVDASPKDIQTIIKLVQTFAGGSVSNIIETINWGNPEQEKDPEKLKQMYTKEAFSRLMMDFIVGNKYDGKEGLYAKDRIGSIVLPDEVHLAIDPVTHKQLAQRPGPTMSIADPEHKGQTIIVDNPEYWEFGTYAKLASKFAVLKQEIISGRAFGDGSYNGKVLSSDELSQKLTDAQMIPAQIAKLNAKVDVANAKVQIYIDALEAFKTAHDQMDAVTEVTPSSTLTGDNADYAKSIDALFKLMKTKMLAASSEATFTTLHGGVDANGKQHFQTGTIVINDHKALYSATKGELEKLNDLMTELNSGSVGADFEDRMGKLFTSINTQFSGQSVKGVMPGMPSALKNMLKDFFAHNTVGSDNDAVEHKYGGLFSSETLGKPSSAAKSFAKFFVENWDALFDHGGVFTDKTGRGIVRFLGGSWNSPIGLVTQITGRGKYDNIMFKDLVKKIHQAEAANATDPVDTKLMQLFIDEFQKHVS